MARGPRRRTHRSVGGGTQKRVEGNSQFGGGLKVIVDLRNVVSISQEGRDVLFEMMSQGVKFICGGVLNRHVLRELARKITL